MTTATTGALSGAPAVAGLRHARDELRRAIDAGAVYLLPILDEVEAELLEAIVKRRRAREEGAP